MGKNFLSNIGHSMSKGTKSIGKGFSKAGNWTKHAAEDTFHWAEDTVGKGITTGLGFLDSQTDKIFNNPMLWIVGGVVVVVIVYSAMNKNK